jgi:hypothetical protein
MNPFFAYLILIGMAIACFVGGNFCDPGPAQQGLVGLGGALVGLALPHLPSSLSGAKTAAVEDKKLGPPSPNTPVV